MTICRVGAAAAEPTKQMTMIAATELRRRSPLGPAHDAWKVALEEPHWLTVLRDWHPTQMRTRPDQVRQQRTRRMVSRTPAEL